MNQLVIRQARKEDSESLAKTDLLCFTIPWSRKAFESEFEYENEAFYIIAEIGDDVAGYMGMRMIFDEGHITNVAVKPEYRRKHVAKAMMTVFLEEGKKRGINSFTLEVRESNEPAINLYKSFGFTEEGKRKNYYPDNHEAAIIMWLYR